VISLDKRKTITTITSLSTGGRLARRGAPKLSVVKGESMLAFGLWFPLGSAAKASGSGRLQALKRDRKKAL
jgi:hypothetical protein